MKITNVSNIIAAVGVILLATSHFIRQGVIQEWAFWCGGFLACTWNGWYLRGIYRGCFFIYFSGAIISKGSYIPGTLLSFAGIALAIFSHGYRTENNFWAELSTWRRKMIRRNK
jgi:hypothetical protein